MSDSPKSEGFLSFLLGGILGACVAMLFAPGIGKETRKKLKLFLEDIDENAHNFMEESKEKINDRVNGTKNKILGKTKKEI